MKKFLLSAAAICSTLATFAQPTLTASSNTPVAGEIYYGHTVDTAGIVIGASGTGVTWNYAAAAQTGLDTITFMSCASTPYCDTFPGSTLANLETGDYTYFTTSATAVTALGGYTSSGAVHLSNAQDIMRFPFSYNSSYVDTAVASLGMATLTDIDSSTADGWGTLILPSGTLTNVLRVHRVTHQNISAMGFPISSERTESYTFYRPGFHYMLMNISIDTANTGTGHVSEARYFTGSSSTGIASLGNNTPDILLYPNPANLSVHISCTLADAKNATITICDLTGKVIIEMNDFVQGANDLTINTSALPDGIYIARLTSAAGTTTRKFTVSK